MVRRIESSTHVDPNYIMDVLHNGQEAVEESQNLVQEACQALKDTNEQSVKYLEMIQETINRANEANERFEKVHKEWKEGLEECRRKVDENSELLQRNSESLQRNSESLQICSKNLERNSENLDSLGKSINEMNLTVKEISDDLNIASDLTITSLKESEEMVKNIVNQANNEGNPNNFHVSIDFQRKSILDIFCEKVSYFIQQCFNLLRRIF